MDSKYIGVGYCSLDFEHKLSNPAIDFHLLMSKDDNCLYYIRCLELDRLIYANSLKNAIGIILQDIAEHVLIKMNENNFKDLFKYKSDHKYWKTYTKLKEKISLNTINKIKEYKKNPEAYDVIPHGKEMPPGYNFGIATIELRQTWMIEDIAG